MNSLAGRRIGLVLEHVQVGALLPGVARHVVKPVAVGPEAPDRGGVGVAELPHEWRTHRMDGRMVPPKEGVSPDGKDKRLRMERGIPKKRVGLLRQAAIITPR